MIMLWRFEMPKVYCENCKHLSQPPHIDLAGIHMGSFCKATLVETDTPLCKNVKYAECEIVNNKNDCSKYKPNWWKQLKDKWNA